MTAWRTDLFESRRRRKDESPIMGSSARIVIDRDQQPNLAIREASDGATMLFDRLIEISIEGCGHVSNQEAGIVGNRD
jgi:hypothetical protein